MSDMTEARNPMRNVDIERIVIYPRDCDERTRERLMKVLQQLEIHYECGYWG
jgi:hypothetical protein